MEDFKKVSILGVLFPSLSMDEFSWLCEGVAEGVPLERRIRSSECSMTLRSWIYENPNWLSQIDEELERVDRFGASILYPGHPNYPKTFMGVHRPPLGLVMLGSPCWKKKKGISVVGSREPMIESERWMQSEFGAFLDRNDVYVLSGAARGVDQIAHSLALIKKRPTVAVLPSGIGKFYPPSFESWKNSIIDEGGAILSEYPVELPMRKSSFHRRNRLIAGMTERLLLVEARRRSGSILTANLAAKTHANVAVIPHHPFFPKARGGLDLLVAGASPIVDTEGLEIWFKGY